MFETRHSGRRGATFQEDTESQYLHLQRQGTKTEEHRGNVLYDFDPKIDESAITLGGSILWLNFMFMIYNNMNMFIICRSTVVACCDVEVVLNR